MDNITFRQWLAAMRDAGLIIEDRHAAVMLGITVQHMVNLKRDGSERRMTGLACSALLAGLAPYSGMPKPVVRDPGEGAVTPVERADYKVRRQQNPLDTQ